MRDWMRRATLRTRLSTLTAAAVGMTVAIAALVSYFVVSGQLYHQVDNELAGDIRIATAFTPDGTFDPGRASALLQRINHQDLLQIIGPSGVSYSSQPQALPASAAEQLLARTPPSANGAGRSLTATRTANGVTYRVTTVSGEDQNGNPLALQVAHPVTDIVHSLRELRLVLLLVALAGVAAAIALGYAVARATIRPVERLTRAAEHVAATQDLDAAIDDRADDELGRLAQAFNAMLAALRSSRQQQAQLVSDAGHELRTPLTSLRTNIEVLLRVQDLPAGDRAELLADVRGQLEELTTLIGDIVELGRHDEQQPEPTEIRLDSLVGHAVERARRRALSVAFDLQLDAGSVRAQPALLERAVLNVLDNAAKWSPPGGRVAVTLHRGDRWTLDVRDHGPGIDPSDIPRIFDRFYRAETARSLPGSGLGLAIVAQVVAGHGGRVMASSPPGGGTLVRIELPIVVEAEVHDELAPEALRGLTEAM